jgi:hypothetical protein
MPAFMSNGPAISSKKLTAALFVLATRHDVCEFIRTIIVFCANKFAPTDHTESRIQSTDPCKACASIHYADGHASFALPIKHGQ